MSGAPDRDWPSCGPPPWRAGCDHEKQTRSVTRAARVRVGRQKEFKANRGTKRSKRDGGDPYSSSSSFLFFFFLLAFFYLTQYSLT